MDVVYVLRKTNNDNIEFRYSLRSLKNLKHDKVFVVWHNPHRTKGLHHIFAEDKHECKYKNVFNKYKMICDDPDISDDFILMNDDIYMLKPVELQVYVKGTLKDHLEYIKESCWRKSIYYKMVQKIHKLFPDGYSYNTHTPMVYNKIKLKALLNRYWDEKISLRSLYWNIYGIEPKKLNENEKISDCKVHDLSKWLVNDKYMSTNNEATMYNLFYEVLDKFFRFKWEYEELR